MAMEFDVLTSGHFAVKTLGDDKQSEDFIVLTLRYQHFPGGAQHSHPPMYLSASAAQNLVLGLTQCLSELQKAPSQAESPSQSKRVQ